MSCVSQPSMITIRAIVGHHLRDHRHLPDQQLKAASHHRNLSTAMQRHRLSTKLTEAAAG